MANELGKADIVFLFDTSGSMDTYIKNVKDNVSKFVTYLQSGGVNDFRLGFVTYDTLSDITTYGFTKDLVAFKDKVGEITANNWGTEYGLTAIQTALQMDFRSDAVKEIIVVTDEGYGENDSYYHGTLTLNDVQTALSNANVKVDVFGETGTTAYKPTSNAYACQYEWEPLANATSWAGTNTTGKFYDMNTDFSKLFESIAEEIVDPTGPNTDTESFTHQLSLAQWNFGFNPVSYTASETTTAALIAGSPAETQLSTSTAIMDEFAAARLSADVASAANAAGGAMVSVNYEAAGNDNGVIPITFGA